jgi:hypothetical protein
MPGLLGKAFNLRHKGPYGEIQFKESSRLEKVKAPTPSLWFLPFSVDRDTRRYRYRRGTSLWRRRCGPDLSTAEKRKRNRVGVERTNVKIIEFFFFDVGRF